ncbi:MAG: thioredoxin-disulfide reductase [Verrucomicrobia bacterium]|nr:thioredoxin-disulfide reductase [Verrucomicrobiota bacterium]
MEKVVIVGSGPAGATAAVYTARANLKPVVIEGMQPGGQLTTTTEVENFPGFPEGITGTELVGKMRDQAARFGAEFVQAEVTSCDFSGTPLKLSLSNEQQLEANTVIIATGASAIYLGLESETKLIGRGVSGCATCDGAFYRNLHVAVVGGGDTAMEDSMYLSRIASKVTLIHRRDEFRASKIMADRVKTNPKIEIIWNSVVLEVLDVSKNEVTGLRLKNIKTGQVSEMQVAGMFVAVGHKPNTDAFKGHVAMDDKGFVITEDTKTNVAGVFAAGDVQDHVYRQAITAAGSGCMAALEVERYLATIRA